MRLPGTTAAVLLTGVLGLAGCAGGTSRPAGATLRLGVDLPLSGADGASGRPALNGIRLALADAHNQVAGHPLVLDVRDDAVAGRHDPGLGAANTTAFVADTRVLALVGPLNSNVARAVIPVAAPARLAIVSPSSSDECLTEDLPAPECDYQASVLRAGNPNAYFRLSATDRRQGEAAAQYARTALGLGKVAAASDSSPYGDLLLTTFVATFQARGGALAVPAKRLNLTDQAGLHAFAAQAAAAGAQALFLGGVDTNGACTVRSLLAQDLPGAFIGGDALLTRRCLVDAAGASPGMLAVSLAPDPTHLPGAADVLRRFADHYPHPGDYGAQSVPAYVATSVVLHALARAVAAAHGGVPTREAVRAAVAATSGLSSPLGPISFTPAGDVVAPLVAVYESGVGAGLTGGVGGIDWGFRADLRLPG